MDRDIDQLKIELERAATALLTDDEICESLQIDENELHKYYDVVLRARLHLKQQLNTKNITNAAINGNIQEILEQIPRSQKIRKNNKGGKREGAGRPKGSSARLTAASLLRTIEEKTGHSFEELITQGYMESMEKNDKNLRIKYESLIMNKVMSNIMEMTPLEQMSNKDIESRIKTLITTEKLEAQSHDNDAQDNNGDNDIGENQ
jgi:hypothetical protein